MVFIPLTPFVLEARQITVSTDGDITSIQKAIEIAEPGDEIIVKDGTYRENNIEITKPLTLKTDGDVIIDGEQTGTIMVIRADDVTISGFTLKNTGRSYINDFTAILVEKSTGFVIENNTLENVFFGIYLAETNGGIVRNNHISAHDRREASSGNGIHLWNVKNPRIEDNTVTGMRDGIYLEFAEKARITGNNSHDNNRYGLHYMFSNGGYYENNRFARNGAGVAVMYSDEVDMINNIFEHNWGTSSYGMLLKDMRQSRIEGNRFYRNTVAIYSESSSNIDIHRNDFLLNGWAVNIKSSSRANRFTENNFVENSFDVRTNSPRNNNEFDRNYWSHYDGYDLDRDGYGDVPYRPVRLFSVIIDRQPESLILLRSMIITLLDMAERVIPVLTPQTLIDENPKMERIR